MKKIVVRYICLILVLIVGLSVTGVSGFAVEGVEDTNESEMPAIDEERPDEEILGEDTDGDNTISVTALDLKTGGSVKVTWTAPEEAEENATYNVVWGTGTGESMSVVGTETTVGNLTDGQEYTFQVTFTATDSEIEYTGSVQVIPTSTLKVSGLKYLKDYNGVTLKWNVPKTEDITGYKFYRNGVLLYTKSISALNKVDTATSTPKYSIYIGGSGFDDKDGKNKPNYGNRYQVVPVVAEGVTKYTPVGVSITGYCVRPYYVKITFKSSVKLTCHDGDKKTKTFSNGTTVYATGFTSGKYVFYYKINGKYHKFYANRTRTKNASSIYTTTWDYTKEEAENFVNHRGLVSDTSYLIWTSFYTQQVYIFKGSKGKWKCVKTHKISTGKATSPSPNGIKKVWKHVPTRHNLSYWSCFSSYNAFHSVTASSWKKKLGKPASGGCIRNTKSDAYWIYRYCKNGTKVYNY